MEVIFNEPISNFTETDLLITNGEIHNFTAEALNPYTHFTFEITPLDIGMIKVELPKNVVFDRAGNGNSESLKTFNHIFNKISIPTLNEWGIAIFMSIIIITVFKGKHYSIHK